MTTLDLHTDCVVSPWCVFFVQATEVKVNEVDFNPQFVSRMIPKLEWSALVQAADEVSPTARTWKISHYKHEYQYNFSEYFRDVAKPYKL